MSRRDPVERAIIEIVAVILVVGGILGVGCWEGSKWVYRSVRIEVSK